MNSRRTKSYKWVSSTVDSLPVSAVEAGHYRGNKIYIGRAHHGGSLTPGRFSVSNRSVILAYGSQPVEKHRYETLTAQNGSVKWIDYDRTASLIPFNAVEGGYSELFHEKLYIGRVKHLGETLVGGVHGRKRTCCVAWEDNKQVLEFYNNFQILVQAG